MYNYDDLKCPICGEDTVVYYGNPQKYGLCAYHSKQLKDGEIEMREEYDTRIFYGKQNLLQRITGNENIIGLQPLNNRQKRKDYTYDATQETTYRKTTTEENDIITIDSQNRYRCITCGDYVDGLLFCSSCYYKYRDRELTFKIRHCSEVELMDSSYEGDRVCNDGHIVKSKTEREIDNFLFDHRIRHGYERALPYGTTSKEVLHPDFYLPDYLGEGQHVYIEHWGYDESNIEYTKTKKYKLSIYKKLGITLVCTYEKNDAKDINAALRQKLNKNLIQKGKINFLEE